MIMIRYPHFAFLVSVVIGLAHTSRAQLAKDEVDYLKHSFSVPSPGLVLDDDAIIRFEMDVTGDGIEELFFSKESLRDGKMGNIWSIYSVNPSGELTLVGEDTFRHDALAPSAWKNDRSTFGFYSYFPGGGGKGLLSFFKVDENQIRRLEKREIEPNGADKAEFDGLFGARLTGESPKIDLKRTALPKQQTSTTPSSVENPLSGNQQTVPLPKPPPIVQRQTPKAPEVKPASPTPSAEPASSTPWSIIAVLIVAALGLLWLLLKGRK